MILAGDIGGTKTVLALISKHSDGSWQCVQEQTFASGEFQDFDSVLDLFLANRPVLTAACFGVAGPIIDQRCRTVNLPWTLDGEVLQQRLGTSRVKLLNDLEAMAIGMLHLAPEDCVELNPNAREQSGNMAVIAAGTGLGEAIIYRDGERCHAIGSEGGHADLAAQNSRQDRLLAYLRGLFPGHVSCERVLSGPGFGHLYDFVLTDTGAEPCPAVPVAANAAGIDRNAVISRLGVAGENTACSDAVQLFVEIYGQEAGNLALKALATGGVFIGGGIGPKIRPALETGAFMKAFSAKGRLAGMLETVSVKLVLNQRTPLLGAMHYFAG